ncbi:ATP-dependent Clp protease proteolytic subunit [Fusobacterium necrophorum subsp. funduliforme]|uniref:Clp protease ClpP n=1 Tax=Fusobacterium necrophorum TaxID=859 RepID=UPI00370E3FBD
MEKGRDVFLMESITIETSKRIIQELISLDKEEGEITLYLGSPGGNTNEGFAIYDVIKHLKNKVTCIVTSRANSMASIILQAASTRKIHKHAHIYIHETMVAYTNNERFKKEDLEEQRDNILRWNEWMVNIYSERINVSKEELKNWLKKETCLYAEEALKYGFVDEII